jgi:hypothetical protein
VLWLQSVLVKPGPVPGGGVLVLLVPERHRGEAPLLERRVAGGGGAAGEGVEPGGGLGEAAAGLRWAGRGGLGGAGQRLH